MGVFVANLVVGMGGERGNKHVGVSEQERCLCKDMNRLSKYMWNVHNNCIKYLCKDTNRLVDCEHGYGLGNAN
jgi:hypothetical protein